jgi:LPS O-antigen subunit length determinant protein (WzzB/FepE family)
MEKMVQPEALSHGRKADDIIYYRDISNDEIDLGLLLLSLAKEWKAMAVVMVIGVLGSIALALFLPKDYLIEAMLRAPTVHELGDINSQEIIAVTPADALGRVVDQILAPDVQKQTLENSELVKKLSETSSLTTSQLTAKIQEDLSLTRVRYAHYELEKGDKTPFKEVSIALKSSEPELAVDYIQLLIDNAQAGAMAKFSNDVRSLKDKRIKNLQDQLASLSLAEKQIREAEIIRLQETNQESIVKLQQQIDLEIRQAIQDRDNRIIQLEEALKTAQALGIEDPVTWDDLRPQQSTPAQINNELGGESIPAPLYFRGTRILRAELDMIRSREDIKPFVAGLTALEKQIMENKNDPKIAALQTRANDTIYLEQYDKIQREITGLVEQPTQFESTQMAVISQPALAPPRPMRGSMIIVLIGILLSGFLALIVVIVRVSIRNSKSRQSKPALADY